MNNYKVIFLFIVVGLTGFQNANKSVKKNILFNGGQSTEELSHELSPEIPQQFIVVLGICQDAGYPQIGCEKACCKAYWTGKEEKKHVVSFAIVDPVVGKYWLFESCEKALSG